MLLVLVVLVGALVVVGIVAWTRHARGLARLFEPVEQAGLSDPSIPRGVLRRWLSRAGFQSAAAPALFVAGSGLGLVVGAVAWWASQQMVAVTARSVAQLPGGIGESLGAALGFVPWLLLVLSTVTPALVVRSERRARVGAVDRDLPLVLELLATLAQAGLGLDAALTRVVDVQPEGRPLTAELRRFQRDLLAGVPRLVALRNLAARVDVTSLTVFVAAIVQAEQVGASMAETLRHQADDLRLRRREQALLSAQSLPVKLVLPLVVCFLPGIFLSTLGPVLYQMLQVADSVLRPVAR